ncbi:MAG: (2Fe-2S)-binding protein, partial [Spirochaeta sp.]|nr:(2Fe-2S)-binding protein [Spirochaeta sp.]
MSTRIHCTINGEKREFSTATGTMLVEVLRDHLGLVGTKNGCGNGQCGACAVLVNDKLTRSCVTPVAKLEGSTIETVESLSRGGQLHALQEAFVAEGAVQCGFCTPGMLMAAKALLLQNSQPTHREIREAMEPQFCRCTGYSAIVRAVRRVAGLP